LTVTPPQPGDNLLSINHGDTITGTYSPLMAEASADVDCALPAISDVTVLTVSDSEAVIAWQTDEPASSIVHYGLGSPTGTAGDQELTTDHNVLIDGLAMCSEYVFFVESQDGAGNVAIDDNSGGYYSFTTWQRVVLLEATMDSDPGWSTENQWAWGVPQGASGDPTGGITGSHVVGYNLNGAYTNNMPETCCTTQPIDCSGANAVYLEYYHWLGIESASWDHAAVRVSTDGGTTWTPIWDHIGGSIAPNLWSYAAYDISSVAAGSADVRIRWVMGTTDSSVVYCGWNIDDVTVSYTIPCTPATPTPAACIHHGDVDFNDAVTAGDAQMAFLIALGSVSPTYEQACAADCNGDDEVTAGDAQQIFLTALGSGACADPL
ncbi:hypothetical protein JXA80_02225, partial [bacterium]|nr:hypothetical protein [candidate division CSSED10-310 bacterium]